MVYFNAVNIRKIYTLFINNIKNNKSTNYVIIIKLGKIKV